MSHSKSDPDRLAQFRRRWSDDPVRIKFLSEMSPRELQALARSLGRQRLRRLQERREREKGSAPARRD